MIEEIVNIYENILPKNPIMLSHDEATKYFERLMMNQNIITYIQDNELVGFIEFWRVTDEQFGRMCLNKPILHDEDLLKGSTAVITRMWITPTLRNGETFLNLGREFLRFNEKCTNFAWLQAHKNHKPLQIYTKDQLFKRG